MQGPRAVPRGEEGPREEAEEGAEEGGKEAPEGGGRGRPEPAGPALGRPAGPGLPLQVGWPPGCACPAAPPVVLGRNGGAAITSPGTSAGGQRWGRRGGGGAGRRCRWGGEGAGRPPTLWSALRGVSRDRRAGTLKVAGDSVSPSHQNSGPLWEHPGGPQNQAEAGPCSLQTWRLQPCTGIFRSSWA